MERGKRRQTFDPAKYIIEKQAKILETKAKL
jgi:hypothetical protein